MPKKPAATDWHSVTQDMRRSTLYIFDCLFAMTKKVIFTHSPQKKNISTRNKLYQHYIPFREKLNSPRKYLKIP